MRNGFYRSVQAVAWDVDTMTANAKQFNEEGSDIWALANDVLSVLKDEILGPVKARGKRGSKESLPGASGSATRGEAGLTIKLKISKGFGNANGASTAGTVEEYSEVGDESVVGEEEYADGDDDEDEGWGRSMRGRGRRRRARMVSDDDDDEEGVDAGKNTYPPPEKYENGALLGSEADAIADEDDAPYDAHAYGANMGGVAGNGYAYAPHYTIEDANALASPDIIDKLEEDDELDAEGSEVDDDELWHGTGYGGMSNGVGAYGDTPSLEGVAPGRPRRGDVEEVAESPEGVRKSSRRRMER
ncbi:hypothetical protein HK097_006694 [Rhizophlyctis rosea]|uniref:Bromo domain-containing protein n=1 Tax=Rhizophlyctis rosea TaxID=64517 RepID=A0AAD5SFI7_9FUNG|nr:hypothetical protein HK097_006694 [Rhizophlyctis rosea]